MKQTFIFLAFLMSSISLSAQWKIGPKVSTGAILQGAESYRILPMSDNRIYDLEFVGGSSTYSAGLMAYRNLGPFFLQTEALATSYSLEFRMDNYKSLDQTSPIYSENYYILEVPFVAGVQLKNNFKLGLGPIAEVRADKNSQFQKLDYYRDTTKPVEFGFQALLGYTTGILHVDLRYVNKFDSIADGFNFGNDEMKLNKSANRLSLSIGLAF
jgi:hypothetical protein